LDRGVLLDRDRGLSRQDRRSRSGGDHAREVAGRPLATRIAIVMPIYNEDVARVSAGIDAIWTSVQEQSDAAAFDFFILSDTRSAEIAARRSAPGVRSWRSTTPTAASSIGAARRTLGRKSGNIADFITHLGRRLRVLRGPRCRQRDDGRHRS
jgi:membrane glycosyltransferase